METTCAVPVCELKPRCKGLCNAHYARALKNDGDPGTTPINRAVKSRGCLFPDCGNKHGSGGYCAGHALQLKKGKQLTELRRYHDSTARDADGNRFCGTCSAWKQPDQFHRTANTADGLASRCVDCRRGRKLAENFRLSQAEYDRMLTAQGGGCAICGGASRNGAALSVDHDHACCETKGKSCGECVRGLLCEDCNRAIGMMRDEPARLRAAAEYLEGHQR